MDGFSWITRLVDFWFWMRVASDRNEYQVGRWFTSVLFTIMLLAPFAFQSQGIHSWVLWPILLIGIGGVAYKIQQLSDRIWHYSGKKRPKYEKQNLGPEATFETKSIFGLR
jgi:fatty acid desaturase